MTSAWRGFDRILDLLAVIAAVMLALMFGAIIYDVVTRTLRMFQITWAVALTEYGLLYVTALGAPWLLRERGHVSMEAFRSVMSPTVARRIETFVLCICAVACVIVAVAAVPVVIRNLPMTDMRASFLPRWLLFAPLVLSFGLCAIQFARFLITRQSMYRGVTAKQEGL